MRTFIRLSLSTFRHDGTLDLIEVDVDIQTASDFLDYQRIDDIHEMRKILEWDSEPQK